MLDKLLNEVAYLFSGNRWDRRSNAEVEAAGRVATVSARIDFQRIEVSRHAPSPNPAVWTALQAGVEAIEQEAYQLDRLFYGNFARSHSLLSDMQGKLRQLKCEFERLVKPG